MKQRTIKWIIIIVILCSTAYLFKKHTKNSIKIAANYQKSLLSPEAVSHYNSMRWSESHMAKIDTSNAPYLGGGMLYYGIVQTNLSKVAVVIGSGGGFVPKIVAQSQRDAAIADAYTYYIDADINVTNTLTGQVYGMPSLDKIHLDDNLYLLKMRSSYAAKIFAKEGIKIDYLHIDGDHSVKGILEDWNFYYPLLAKNAVVTFHDYSSVPDVKEALKKIKQQCPDIQLITFPHAGAGIALAYLPLQSEESNKDNTKPKQNKLDKYINKGLQYFNNSSSNLLNFFSQNPNTHEMLMEDAFYIPESGGKKNSANHWSYLATPPFQKRYEIASTFLRDTDNILEIGGFPNSIIYYVADNTKTISSVEPFGNNEFIKNISYEAMKRKIDLTIYPTLIDTVSFNENNNYAIIWLGMNLSYYNQDEMRRALTLLANSKKAVIETFNYAPSLKLMQFIKKTLNPKIIQQQEMTIDSQDSTYVKRTLYFIEGFNPIKGYNSDETIIEFLESNT